MIHSIYAKTDLSGYDGTNVTDHFEVISGQTAGRFCESPVEYSDQLVYVDVDAANKTASINLTKKAALENAKLLEQQAKDAIKYRSDRARLYAERISPEKNSLTSIGDCLDGIIETLVMNNIPLSPKLSAIVTIIQNVKAEVPQP